MRVSLSLVLLLLSVACAPVREQTRATTPPGESVVSLGDQMVRIDRAENLPNLFGRSDMLGRTRAKGYVELRYFGMDRDGNPRFRRRDVDLVSTQTTISESGINIGIRSDQRQRGGGRTTTVIGMRPLPGTITALPPDTIEFTLDLRESNIITMLGRVIEVLHVSPNLIRFRVYDAEAIERGGLPVEAGAGPPAGLPPAPGTQAPDGNSYQDRGLPQNQPRDWNGIPMVRPPP